MGCGASASMGGANAPTKQADKGNSFGKDIGSFLMKLIKDPSYASNLLEELKKPEEPENQVEKLLKLLMGIVAQMESIITPDVEMSKFIAGCLIGFLYQMTVVYKTPEKGIDHKELLDLQYDVECKFAEAVYDLEEAEDPKVALAAKLAKEPAPRKVDVADIIFLQPESQLGKPAHAVILDRERQLVVVAVRGTANLKDVITDLAGTPAEWNGGHAHMAMAMSANGLYAKHKDLIVQLLNDNPGYALRTTGHSLGGGVAGMLALQLHRDDDIVKAAYRTLPVPNKKDKGNYMITSVGFGSAAALSKELTEEAHRFVTTIVNDSDIVPRLNVNNVAAFIRLSCKMCGVFESIAGDVKMLLTGKTPEGWDFKKMMKIGSKITSDPSGVLRDLVEEKLEAAAEGEEEPAEPAVRLYAPGRLVFLQKPAKGDAYSIFKGSMASESSTKLLLKGSMMADHGVAVYVTIVATGKPSLA